MIRMYQKHVANFQTPPEVFQAASDDNVQTSTKSSQFYVTVNSQDPELLDTLLEFS